MEIQAAGNTVQIILTDAERAALDRGEELRTEQLAGALTMRFTLVPSDPFATGTPGRTFGEMFPQLVERLKDEKAANRETWAPAVDAFVQATGATGQETKNLTAAIQQAQDEAIDQATVTITRVEPVDPYPGESIPCRRCHRPLTNVTSKIRGIGPICAGREIVSAVLPTEQKLEQLQQLLKEAQAGDEDTAGIEAMIAQLQQVEEIEDEDLFDHAGEPDRIDYAATATAWVDHVFNEVFNKVLPGYEAREPQVRLSREIAEAMATGEHCVAEAGTGTGKSLAYSVPAVKWARDHHKPVVITTGTIALQEQLTGKDLPFLKKALVGELDFTFALVKGKGNYLCRLKAEDEAQKQGLIPDPDWPRLWEWIRTTDTGDKSTIQGWIPPADLWTRVNVDDACLKRDCPHYLNCHLYAAKRRAKEADVLVCNHSLYMADVQVRMSSGDGASILPPHVVAVFDEAHHIEDVASESFGAEISQFKIPSLTKELRRIGHPDIPEQQMDLAVQANDALFAIFPTIEPRVDHQSLRRLDDWEQIKSRMLALASRLKELADRLEQIDFKHSDEKTKKRVASIWDRSMNLHFTLVEMTEDDPEWVNTVQVDWSKDKPRATLKHSPISVAGLLREYVWDPTWSAVCTSATISSGQKFGYFRRQVGLDEGKTVRELIVDSPFDYPNQSMLYIPRGLPEPNQEFYGVAIQPVISDVLHHTEGRAFVLFTSYRQMQGAIKILRPDLERAGYTVMMQGEKARSELVQDFKADIHSILFATASFWEGVDVQGEALSCVIIDKIPFDSPGDPILEARQKAIEAGGGNPFMEFNVPRAVIKLKQGVGRLIRTRTDKGLIAILDPRLRTKPYGKVFLRSLPPMREIFCLDDVPAFLAGGDD